MIKSDAIADLHELVASGEISDLACEKLLPIIYFLEEELLDLEL